MKINFDSNIRIAGIGLVPWTRLGPEQWLPSYTIASLYGWDLQAQSGLPKVLALSDEGMLPNLPRLNTQALLRTPEFQKLLQDKLPGYDLLTYKPVTPPSVLADRKFLMVDKTLENTYENKINFRQKFADKLTFPSFHIYKRAQLEKTPETFAELMAGRKAVVVQDEQLSGGKGTHVVISYEHYVAALDNLAALSEHAGIVVSSLIANAKELSIQACVTKTGTIMGPMQQQIIRHPSLCNTHVPQGDKFCGAQITAAYQQNEIYEQAKTAAQLIGATLQDEGYKGIFGVDFLLDERGQLFVLEVNPRLTGVTPLLTALYRGEEGVPFYLLHLLELGGYEYAIEDATAEFTQTGALLVMHSLDSGPVVIKSLPASGTYKIEGGTLVQVSRNVQLQNLQEDEFIFQEYMPPQMTIKPGGRLATLQFKREVIDDNTDKLYKPILETIEIVQRYINTQRSIQP